MSKRPSAIQMPPLALPQSQPTRLSTPFTTPTGTGSTQIAFEYPFTPSPPSPALQQDSHDRWETRRTPATSPKAASSPPVPPTLLTTKGRQRAKIAMRDGGPVMEDTKPLATLKAQQIRQTV